MGSMRVSNRYAKALLDLARERQALDAVKQDSDLLLAVIQDSRDLRSFLKSPIIKPDQKIKTIKAAFAGQLSDLTGAFLELLVKHSREEDLQGILQNYNSLYFAERNVVRARITAASPLDADQVARLLALLKTPESSDVQLEQVVDETLIGGFVLRVADQQVDASVATALATLDREFQKNLYIADF